MRPLVSILVRSMDRATLPHTLATIAAQDYSPIEVVVVSARGPEHCALPERCGAHELRLVVPPGRLDRVSAANTALLAARGEWLNFLDDDDELLPGHVAALRTSLDGAPGIRLAYSRARQQAADGRQVDILGRPSIFFRLFEVPFFHIAAAMFSHELVEAGARFDSRYPIHDDLDFWIQCAQHTDFAFVDAITNVWNAEIGSSGAGSGDNCDSDLLERGMQLMEQKWGDADRLSRERSHALLIAGQAMLRSGRAAEAIKPLEEALALRPRDVNALSLSGLARVYVGDADIGHARFARALQFAPGHPGLRNNLAIAADALGLVPGAESRHPGPTLPRRAPE